MKNIILTVEQLNNLLPIELKEYKHYDVNFLLKDVIFGFPKELVDGRFLCNACLRDKIYLLSNNVENEPLKFEYDLFEKYYGELIEDISKIDL